MITVIGSFVMDMVAHTDRFPQAGETVLGSSIHSFPGGKGVNQCVAVSRLGGVAQMIGKLGNDGNGRIFRDLLKAEGIDSKFVFESDVPTAVAQVQIDSSAQNRIIVIPSANYEFNMDDVDKIDDCLHNSEIIILQLELKKEIVFELINRCHKYNTPVLLNPAPAIKIGEDILSKVTYLTPNETELGILTGMPTDNLEEQKAAAKKLNKSGVKCCIVTLGGKGALISTNDCTELVDGYHVKVVDTVAAGDSFNGAFAVALSEGKSLKEAVKFANAMGALTVQVNGAIPSLHTRPEVDRFIKEH